ncbi:MAG: phosphodiester glycosidase family protein, partial [Clostridia bacterium]|nr:phosphodiester glycosidase family protein [Clostridia bacterium]
AENKAEADNMTTDASNDSAESEPEADEEALQTDTKDEPTKSHKIKKLKRRRPKKKGKTIFKVIRRILLCFFTLILLIVAGLYGVFYVVFKGPSPAARDKLVTSTLEMSAMKWVAPLFFSQEEIQAIIDANAVVESDDTTNPGLVVIPDFDDPNTVTDEWANYPDGIRIENVKGDTYRGYVMLVRDPSKVYVATSSDFRSNQPGLKIFEALEKEGAIAGVNGGGFPDGGGVGTGEVPIGLTISKGELRWGERYYRYSNVIGFNKDNVLMVGHMSGQEALDKGMRDCVCFGPILIVNGEPLSITGDSGSLNPRTAIGQRADGAVILLCVDGRMPGSLGASYADLINIMVEYGAVNAANLDGGSSTHMYYKGEPVNVSSSLYGPRKMPTFFFVKG